MIGRGFRGASTTGRARESPGAGPDATPAANPFVDRRGDRLEQVEGCAGSALVEHTRGRAGHQASEQAECEAADPEERRVAEQPVVRGQAANLVEVALVSEQCLVGCTTAPLGSAVKPEV